MRSKLALAVLAAALCACFGLGGSVQVHSYYVLQGNPALPATLTATLSGLVRVRNLDTASAYDKFQIVVRKSPFELRYAQTDVWAVKPNQMMSDLIAKTFSESELFSAVTRELGEARPDYTLDGDLRSIEVYDSGDLWFAHLAFSLRLSSFETGRVLWSFAFDERKPIYTRTFSHAVRTLSELLTSALERALPELADTCRRRSCDPSGTEAQEPGAGSPPPAPPAAAPGDKKKELIFVPEKPRTKE